MPEEVANSGRFAYRQKCRSALIQSGIFVMIEADSGFADHMETGVFLKGEFYDRNRMSGRRKRNAF